MKVDQEGIGRPMTHALDLMQIPTRASAVVPPKHKECPVISLEGKTAWMQLMNHEWVGT